MKTKITLGKSVNDKVSSLMYKLIASPTDDSLNDSVKSSLWNSVWNSGYDSITDIMIWDIEL